MISYFGKIQPLRQNITWEVMQSRMKEAKRVRIKGWMMMERIMVEWNLSPMEMITMIFSCFSR